LYTDSEVVSRHLRPVSPALASHHIRCGGWTDDLKMKRPVGKAAIFKLLVVVFQKSFEELLFATY